MKSVPVRIEIWTRTRKLYRERWKWTRQRAYQLIDAAEAANDVSPMGNIPAPSNERQARELAKAPAADRPKVWAEVVKESETSGKPITASTAPRRRDWPTRRDAGETGPHAPPAPAARYAAGAYTPGVSHE